MLAAVAVANRGVPAQAPTGRQKSLGVVVGIASFSGHIAQREAERFDNDGFAVSHGVSALRGRPLGMVGRPILFQCHEMVLFETLRTRAICA